MPVNDSKVPHFLEIVVIHVCVLLCMSKVFLRIMAMIVRIEHDCKCF